MILVDLFSTLHKKFQTVKARIYDVKQVGKNEIHKHSHENISETRMTRSRSFRKKERKKNH